MVGEVHETVILLHPPPPVVGVSMWMERGCQQNDMTVSPTANRLGANARAEMPSAKAKAVAAVGETVILLYPPLPLVGVSISTHRGVSSK